MIRNTSYKSNGSGNEFLSASDDSSEDMKANSSSINIKSSPFQSSYQFNLQDHVQKRTKPSSNSDHSKSLSSEDPSRYIATSSNWKVQSNNHEYLYGNGKGYTSSSVLRRGKRREVAHKRGNSSFDSPNETQSLSSDDSYPSLIEGSELHDTGDRRKNRSHSLIRHQRSHASLGALGPMAPLPEKSFSSNNTPTTDGDWYRNQTTSMQSSFATKTGCGSEPPISSHQGKESSIKKSSFAAYKKAITVPIGNVKKGVQKSIAGIVNKVQDTFQGDARDSRETPMDVNEAQCQAAVLSISSPMSQEEYSNFITMHHAIINFDPSPLDDVACMFFTKTGVITKTDFVSPQYNTEGDLFYSFEESILIDESILSEEIGIRLMTESDILAQGVATFDWRKPKHSVYINLPFDCNGKSLSQDVTAKVYLTISCQERNNILNSPEESNSNLTAQRQHRLKELNIDVNGENPRSTNWEREKDRRRSAVHKHDEYYEISPTGELSSIRIDTKSRRISNISSNPYVSPLSPEEVQETNFKKYSPISMKEELKQLRIQTSQLQLENEALRKSIEDLETNSKETTIQYKNHILILERRLNGIESSSFNMSKSVNLMSSEFPLLQARLAEQVKDMEKYHQHMLHLENLINAGNKNSKWFDMFFYILGLIIKYICYIVVWLYKIIAFFSGKKIKDDPNLPGLSDLVVFMKQERENLTKVDAKLGSSFSSFSLYHDEDSALSSGTTIQQSDDQLEENESGYISANDDTMKDEIETPVADVEEDVSDTLSQDSNLSDQLMDMDSKPNGIPSTDAMDSLDTFQTSSVHNSFDEWYRQRSGK